MKSWLLLPLALLIALLSVRLTPPPDEGNFRVVRAYYTDPEQVRRAAGWIEPWEVNTRLGYIVVDVDEAGFARLESLGFRLEFDQALTDLANRPPVISPLQADGIPGYACYRTVNETYAAAEALVAAYPSLASWSDIGDTWEKTTLGRGRDLKVLRLTNAAIPGPKPKLFAMGSVHAREYAPAELLTRFAEQLLKGYGMAADLTWLLDYHEIHLLLQANPDGRMHAESGQLWRKNTNQAYCSPTSANRGADLNRNYDFGWGCCGGSSGSTCSELYRGQGPASEPEVQAIQAYLRANFPDQRGPDLGDPAPLDASGIFLDVHAYGDLVLWPWGFTYEPAPNQGALQTLGRKYAYFTGYTAQQSYEMYPTDGDSDSFAYGDLGLASYTIELGDWFFQDCATFEGTILPANLAALTYMAKAASAPYLLPAGPEALDLVAAPLNMNLGVLRLQAVINDRRYPAGSGEPMQTIAQAEYMLDTPPWLPEAQGNPLQPVDGAFDERVEAVEALIDISGLSPGRHTLYVRGKDARDNWGVISAGFIYTQEFALMLPLVLR
jgi:murein tripeptide amidase MpaA